MYIYIYIYIGLNQYMYIIQIGLTQYLVKGQYIERDSLRRSPYGRIAPAAAAASHPDPA